MKLPMYQILLFVGMQRRTKASEAEFPGIVWMRVLALFCLLLPFVASLPVWGQSEPNISGKCKEPLIFPLTTARFSMTPPSSF